MKKMKNLAMCSLLITMFLMGAVCVSPVSAEENGESVDLSTYTLPCLKENESIGTITISGTLSPQSEINLQSETKNRDDEKYGIPFGSVIVHSNDGITRVFDKNGIHLLSVSDDRSKSVPTPTGIEKSCTRVHEVPNDSRVYHRGDRIYILSPEDELILLIIDECSSANQGTDNAVRGWVGNDWLEYAQDESAEYISEYTAYWDVPTAPPSLDGETERIYLFNGIEPTDTKFLLQPVIEYNYRWQGAAWACDTTDLQNGDTIIGPYINTNTGDHIKGRIYWSESSRMWSIVLQDYTSGEYSSITTDCVNGPQRRNTAACVLEGWHVDDLNDLPGNTLFHDMSYKASGQQMSIDLEASYSRFAPREIINSCYVDIQQNPSRVRLRTDYC
jgi:hypothetical protein